jgi:hypothetical protein
LIVLELPVIGVGGLTSLVETVEKYSKFESVLPASPVYVVAQRVDILKAEGRGSGIGRSELGIPPPPEPLMSTTPVEKPGTICGPVPPGRPLLSRVVLL